MMACFSAIIMITMGKRTETETDPTHVATQGKDSTEEGQVTDSTRASSLGYLFALLSALCFASVGILVRKFSSVHWNVTIFQSMLIACVISAVNALI